MSTLKVNSIQHSNGTDALTIDSAGNTSFSGVVTGTPLGNRNLIINGDMRIDQRNGGATTGWAQGFIGIDRFRCRSDATITTSNVTYEQSTDVPSGQGFLKSMQLNCILADTSLATDARYSIEHRIEGNNFSHLEFGTANAKTFTLSFWVKSNVTGTYSLTFANDDVSNIRRYMTTFTIDSANTWEKKIITVNGNTGGNWYTDNRIGLSMQIVLVAGSSLLTSPYDWTNGGSAYNADTSQVNFISSTDNYFRLTGLQLEVGDTATPFEHRPYDMELARCQRYAYMIPNSDTTGVGDGALVSTSGYMTTGGNMAGIYCMPVTMRYTPVISVTGTSNLEIAYTDGTITTVNGTSVSLISHISNKNQILYLVTGSAHASQPAFLRYKDSTMSPVFLIEAEL